MHCVNTCSSNCARDMYAVRYSPPWQESSDAECASLARALRPILHFCRVRFPASRCSSLLRIVGIDKSCRGIVKESLDRPGYRIQAPDSCGHQLRIRFRQPSCLLAKKRKTVAAFIKLHAVPSRPVRKRTLSATPHCLAGICRSSLCGHRRTRVPRRSFSPPHREGSISWLTPLREAVGRHIEPSRRL